MCARPLIVVSVLWFAYVSRGSGTGTDSAASRDENAAPLGDCIDCVGDSQQLQEPQMHELIKQQKIAQRLEYIMQQLIANLHTETRPKDPPKLNTLPEFLVERLVSPQSSSVTDAEAAEYPAVTKQVVLFPEEGNVRPAGDFCLCI